MTVYADECVLAGELVRASTFPSDPLAEWESLTLRDVIGLTIVDGQLVTLSELSLLPDEIVAVSMRLRPPEPVGFRRYRVTLWTGPYVIEGSIHALPASDPIANLRRRSRIELGDAAIEYRVAGRPRRELVPGLSLNRDLVESMAEATDYELQRDTDIILGRDGVAQVDVRR